MGESTNGGGAPGQPGPRGTEDPIRALEGQLRAVRAIGVDALFEEIVGNVSELMRAERSTLFLYDSESHTIWSKIAQGETDLVIRLDVGRGIAGWVAAHRQSVNIPDAYEDDRFNRKIDAETGFRTRSVAAVPLLDRNRNLLGVLQVLNHRGGAINEEDMGLLEAAHSLKGGAAIIGLTRVSAEAHRIEIAASRGDLASVMPSFWRIQYELSRLRTAVAQAAAI